MGTITKTVQQPMDRFQQKHKKLDKLTQPGWENAADYFRKCDKKYGTSKWTVPAVIQLQTADNPVAPAQTTFGVRMECLNIVPGISQMPQETSQPGSCHIRLGSVMPQSNMSIPGLEPSVEPNL